MATASFRVASHTPSLVESLSGQSRGTTGSRGRSTTRNVLLVYYLQFMLLTIWGASLGSTFDVYLLMLGKQRYPSDSNSFVGLVESVRGLVGLALAWPLGFLADVVNRRVILGASAVVGSLGVVVLVFGVASDNVPLLIAGVVLTAAFMQSFVSCSGALLVDSVPKERITEVMANQATLMLLGYTAGPLAQIVVALFIGDQWSMQNLHTFICSGFALWPLVLPAFFLFERTLVERDTEAEFRRGQSEEAGTVEKHWLDGDVLCLPKKWFVPCLIELCTLITALGAGMTIKFFPLFFEEDYHFSVMHLNILNAVYSVALAAFVQVCRKITGRIGRCQAVLLYQVIGSVCIFLMWNDGKEQPLWEVLVLYFVRGGFMNSMSPINQAVVMDCVESKYRGRWSALQSISRFSWSGSAFVGGWLSDQHNYRFTFLITGLVYVTSAVCYSPLLLLVPWKKDAGMASGNGAARAHPVDRSADSITQSRYLSLQPPGPPGAAPGEKEKTAQDEGDPSSAT